MIKEPLAFIGTSDLSGKVRGKAFPSAFMEKRSNRGIGWTPTNAQITCFDTIAESPYGALGDLLLVPDPEATVYVDYQDGMPPEHFILGDIISLEGEPWECCTRSILKSALNRLKNAAGLEIFSAFEHEFHLKTPPPGYAGSYTYHGYRSMAGYGQTLMAALKLANIEPDTFMKEFGDGQYEITNAPGKGVKAADSSAILRELVSATASRMGNEASMTPIKDPASVGNGVHIHMSFLDEKGEPAAYDPAGPNGMSAVTGSFIAGILKYLDSIVALTSPSAISYLRLTPHRWSAAYNNLGFQDREASVRICPTTSKDKESIARQYNFEFRVADGASSPHLALAAIVHAGTQGIEDNLPMPNITEEDLSALDEKTLSERGYKRLPTNLEEALDRFIQNKTVNNWFPGQFCQVYHAHKLGELEHVKDMTDLERCAAYEKIY